MPSVGKISKNIYTYGYLVLVKSYKTYTYTPLIYMKFKKFLPKNNSVDKIP